MTEFETKLIEQLEILNKNLSTKNMPSSQNPKPNFAEYFLSNIKNLENRIQVLTNTLGLLTEAVHRPK